MEVREQIILNRVKEKITEIRGLLDFVMYGNDGKITDEEFVRIKESYDLICKANDKL